MTVPTTRCSASPMTPLSRRDAIIHGPDVGQSWLATRRWGESRATAAFTVRSQAFRSCYKTFGDTCKLVNLFIFRLLAPSGWKRGPDVVE
jgi:hypothetical protein